MKAAYIPTDDHKHTALPTEIEHRALARCDCGRWFQGWADPLYRLNACWLEVDRLDRADRKAARRRIAAWERETALQRLALEAL